VRVVIWSSGMCGGEDVTWGCKGFDLRALRGDFPWLSRSLSWRTDCLYAFTWSEEQICGVEMCWLGMLRGMHVAIW
jgi:hypothetical protein